LEVIPQQKYSGKDILPCFLCGESIALNEMQKHVGGHIFMKYDTPDKCSVLLETLKWVNRDS
jgi:hypothetical protein